MRTPSTIATHGSTTAHRLAVVGLVLAAVWAHTALAQAIYRYVGPDGKVTFSDQPPPDAKVAMRVGVSASRGAAEARQPLPFELQALVAKYPVTLYVMPNCSPCNSGRSLLMARGVPHTEKTVETSEDIAAFARISPDNALPLLVLGGQLVKGFSASEWNRYLDTAGYPKNSILAPSYRHAAAQPLVPVKVAPAATAPVIPSASEASAAAAKPASAPTRAAATASNPAGIRF